MWTVTMFCVLTVAVSVCDAQWVQTNGPPGGQVRCLAISGTNLFAASDSGVFLSTNNGTGWTGGNVGLLGFSVLVLAISGTNLFAGNYGNVFISTDNGTNWRTGNTGLPPRSVSAFAVSASNLFAGTGVGVFLSINNGTSWTGVNTGLPNETDVRSLAASGTSLFAGTNGSGIFRSTNNGASWTEANTGLTWYYVSCFAVHGTNLFAGTSRGVFRSTDNGTSWMQSGLTDTSVTALAVSGTNLFAGTSLIFPSPESRGVFLSTNNGTSWTDVNSGWSTAQVTTLAVGSTDLFAGTWAGVWRRPLAEMIVDVEAEKPVPTQFALEQNYPNPFNPKTVIEFQVASSKFVSLKVFDVLGREVATLVNETKQPGTYSVQWDASAVASGMYFYRLSTGSFASTRKMLLMK